MNLFSPEGISFPSYHDIYVAALGQPVPLVTWTQEIWKVMQLEPTIWLLSALNFHLPSRATQAQIFARIPSEWTSDHLYVAALILGPLNSSEFIGIHFNFTICDWFGDIICNLAFLGVKRVHLQQIMK